MFVFFLLIFKFFSVKIYIKFVILTIVKRTIQSGIDYIHRVVSPSSLLAKCLAPQTETLQPLSHSSLHPPILPAPGKHNLISVFINLTLLGFSYMWSCTSFVLDVFQIHPYCTTFQNLMYFLWLNNIPCHVGSPIWASIRQWTHAQFPPLDYFELCYGHWCTSICTASHYFELCSFVVGFQVSKCQSSSFVLLFQDCFYCFGSLGIPLAFQDQFSHSAKKMPWGFLQRLHQMCITL